MRSASLHIEVGFVGKLDEFGAVIADITRYKKENKKSKVPEDVMLETKIAETTATDKYTTN